MSWHTIVHNKIGTTIAQIIGSCCKLSFNGMNGIYVAFVYSPEMREEEKTLLRN